MADPVTREAYFETGMAILSDLGYGGLKLAEVCRRLGVTSGSFYHYFKSWPTYLKELLTHWRDGRTVRLIEILDDEPDARRRLTNIIEIGLNLPHDAESAIRTWSKLDAEVHAIQADVDRQRFEIVAHSVDAIVDDKRHAELFANLALYLLIGFEQSAMPPDYNALRWIMERLIRSLAEDHLATEAGSAPKAPE